MPQKFGPRILDTTHLERIIIVCGIVTKKVRSDRERVLPVWVGWLSVGDDRKARSLSEVWDDHLGRKCWSIGLL